MRGHATEVKTILTQEVFNQLDRALTELLSGNMDVINKMETLLTTMVVDESDYCTAWTQFIMRSIEDKKAPSLASLDINVPARLRYMLVGGDIKQEEEAAKAGTGGGNRAGNDTQGLGQDQEQLRLLLQSLMAVAVEVLRCQCASFVNFKASQRRPVCGQAHLNGSDLPLHFRRCH